MVVRSSLQYKHKKERMKMEEFSTRVLQDNLWLEQVRLTRDTDPEMIELRKQHISYLATELLRRYREESLSLASSS
jgi:hypothetical protein